MSSPDSTAPNAAPGGAARAAGRGRMRLVVGAFALAALLFFLIRGNDPRREEAPEEEPPAARQPVQIPLPKTPHKDLQVEAQGLYLLENDVATFTLELQAESRFRFLSRMSGQEPRIATGTWNIVGNRLTMAYREIDGKALEEATLVRNVYQGDSIVLRETGLPYPVVLDKHTVLRQK
jgi:hypothetical protein